MFLWIQTCGSLENGMKIFNFCLLLESGLVFFYTLIDYLILAVYYRGLDAQLQSFWEIIVYVYKTKASFILHILSKFLVWNEAIFDEIGTFLL